MASERLPAFKDLVIAGFPQETDLILDQAERTAFVFEDPKALKTPGSGLSDPRARSR